jgi:biopolymer transport protein ExbD
MGASIADTDLDDDSDFAESHEINVTPFIDVILVLLIIFMVAAPLSTVDLPIDLPTSTATPQKKPDKPTYVSIKPDLAVAIGENWSSGSIWCARSTRCPTAARNATSSCARTAPCPMAN